MYLSDSRKKLLGTVTALVVLIPLIFIPLGVAVFLYFAFSAAAVEAGQDPSFVFSLLPRFFLLLFPVLGCAALVQLVLQVIYLVLVIQDSRLSDVARMLLVLAVFFFPIIGMAVYYLGYVRGEGWPALAKAPNADI